MLRWSRAIGHAVGARNQQRQKVIINESVFMLEFEVGRRLAIRLHIHRYDDERTGHFAAPPFNGHLT